MLIYHPAYDIYHCTFRLLRLLEVLPRDPHQIDKIRILDFYLLFPSLLKNVKPRPLTASAFQQFIKKLDNPYEGIDEQYKLFVKLEQFQKAALKNLASYDLINADSLLHEKVLRTSNSIPNILLEAINQANSENKDLINLLTGPIFGLEFYGNKGLKARTGLMEYKYDSK